MKTILITGASSGIGYQTAELLAKAGNQVFGAARHVNAMDPLKKLGVIPIVMDVTSESSIKNGLQAIIQKAGKIDILINGAGYGSFGAIENVTIAEAKRQFDVNVSGLTALTKLVLPYMKKQHSGKIINISSMAGRFSSSLAGWYFASKHAVEALSDSLRMEVKRFGIKVVLIEPGAIKSNWSHIAMDHLVKSSRGTDYEKVANKMARQTNKIYASKFASKPSLVAKKIKKVVDSNHLRPRYLFGFSAKPTIFFNAILPTRLMDKLIPMFM